MENNFDIFTSTKNVEPITFGSCISFSLENHNNCFLSTDSFMNPKLNVQKFDSNSSTNFNFSVFRILPFSNFSNFQNQDILHNYLQNFTEEASSLSKKNPKERKEIIQDLKTNLETEINTNMTIYNKLKGTPVLFGTSAFQLVHVATMKYLSLNDQDKDNLYFELIDFPNSRSFFKFLPCLKLQKQRNNFVYNNDLLVLCSTRMILNRNPSLYTNYSSQAAQDQNEMQVSSKQHNKVTANIEETKHWKLHLYQNETDEGLDQNCIRIGDAIWLNLSETNCILATSLQSDPFEHQHVFEGTPRLNRSTMKRSTSRRYNQLETSRHITTEMNQSKEGSHDSLQEVDSVSSDGEEFENMNKFFENEIISRLVLEFKETQSQKNANLIINGMSTGGLWRLESPNLFEGGPLEWERPYRLKHVSTERYLKVQKNFVELSSAVDDNLLFYLVPIKNMLKSDQDNKYVPKDAYFRLQHVNTKRWISFRDDESLDIEVSKKERQSLKIPTSSAKPREIDTFKMIKADFEENWEISFLLSSIPFFVELIEYMKPLVNTEAQKTLTREELQKLKNFHEVADRAIQCIDSLEAFCYNRLPGNIATNQEFLRVSNIRQKILKDQYILGLLCWLLSRGFPTKYELELMEWKLSEEVLKKPEAEKVNDFNSINQTPTKNKQLRKQDLIKMNYIHKKYQLCRRIYELMKTTCIQNSSNQEYTFKFLSFYVPHLGYGTFISDLILEVIRNNEKLLYGLHQVPIANHMITTSLALDKQDIRQQQGPTFLKEVVNKILEFQPYHKKELLKLLKTSCLYQEQAIYINQDKVFKLLFEDVELRSSHLVNLHVRHNELFLSFGNVDCHFGSFFSEENLVEYKKEIEFLKEQMDLYATLCMNRNYSCTRTFMKIFKVDLLLKYITNHQIPEDIRASLVKLMATLHIDREPRTVQEKPNLVRFLEVDLDKLREKGNMLNFLNIFGNDSKSKDNKKKVYVDVLNGDSRFEADKSPTEEITVERDEDIPRELLEKLKRFILGYLQDKSLLCSSKGSKHEKIYTRLTSEVVKITGQMLKFGMFNTNLVRLAKQSRKTQFLAGTAQEIIVNTMMNKMTTYEENDQSEFEKLILYLTPLLEYDEEYFKAMNHLGMERKHTQINQEDKNMLKNVLNSATGLGKSLFALKEIFELTVGGDSKRSRKIEINDESELEIIKDQIFKKPESLKQILDKFSNKTYTIKDEEAPGNFEVDIKIGICEVFTFIYNMREDFMIDNLVHFFKGPYLQKIYDDTGRDIDKMDLGVHIKTLLPESSLEVGTKYDAANVKFKNYTEYQELRSFDEVLGRPFIECLLMGFFFTNSAPLQNELVKLLQRCCSEKANFKDSVEKLELLVSEEHKMLHAKLSKKLDSLKNLTSNAQVWLQIIERSLYQPNYFDIMEACYKKLLQIQAIFRADMENSETTKIKQRIFRYLGGYKTIFEVLQKGFLIFESYLEIFRQGDTTELTLKYKIDIADKIVLLFRVCNSVLSHFCYKNPRYQYLLFQNFNKLMLVNKLNLGQIELMIEIFRDNIDLARSLSEAKMNIFCDLIVLHGRKEIFLEVFNVLLSHPEQNTLDIQKKVLLVLFSDDYVKLINPFGEVFETSVRFRNSFLPDEDSFSYKGKLIEVIAKCLKGKIGVTLISKVFKSIQLKSLIQFLYEVADKETGILADDRLNQKERSDSLKDIEVAKSAAIEILLLYFSTFSQSFELLSDCTKALFDYVELETDRLEQDLMIIGNDGKKEPTFDRDHFIFVLEKLIALVNVCIETYIKDSGAVTVNIDFGHEALQVETASKNHGSKLARQTLKNLEIHRNEFKNNELEMKNLSRLVTILKLQLPQALQELITLEQQDSESGADQIEMSPNRKSIQKPSESWKSRYLRFFSGSSSYIVQHKPTESAALLTRDRSIKKMTIAEVLSAQKDASGQLAVLWKTFRERILSSDDLKKAIKEEVNVMSNSIMNFQSSFIENEEDKEVREMFITSEDLLVKLLNYLEFWIQKKARKEPVIFLIKALSRIIKNVSSKEEMVERQEMLDRLNATKIMLVLIWEEKNDDTQYLYSIFRFMIRLLTGGNASLQKTIYDFFNTNSSSEKFFRKMNHLMLREISQVDYSSKVNVGKHISQLGMKILRLLQLFCEGHNLDLQNYLRQQTNSKNNYDLVTLTTKLLSSYRVNLHNFESVMQCFDTLTEFVQGPCQANQILIANSKFLEFAVSLLNAEEKAIDYLHPVSDVQTSKSYKGSKVTKEAVSASKGSFIATPAGNPSESFSVRKSASGFFSRKRNNMKLNPEQLAKVKYKCLITLVSLLECSTSATHLSNRIMRSIPISVLTDNLVEVYQQYKSLYQKDEYLESAFNHHQDDYEPEKPEYAEFIIENGFNIFILINLFLDNSARDHLEDEELNELMDEKGGDKLLETFNQGFIGELTKFSKSLVSNFVGVMEIVKKNVIDKAIKSGMVNAEEANLLREEIEKKQLIREAISFFRSNMGHIEIVRNGKLQKIYFPVLPFCKYLSKDLKDEFQETVNRTSTKTKIADLMTRSDYLIKNMKHEEKLARLFNRYRIFGMITNHFKLWEYSSFIIGIILNILVIGAYSDRFGDRLSEPHLFLNPGTAGDIEIIKTLGVLNLIFSSLVVAHFFLKRAPLLIEDIWVGFWEQKFNLIKTPLVFIGKVLYSFIRGLKDFDILYNCLVICFAILGLALHPFFFFFSLTDIARIELLKNVVKAVWEPRIPLILTIMVFLLVEYYFTLIGYTFFYSHYNGGRTCESLLECLLTTIDQTFKQTGATGAYLQDPELVYTDESGQEQIIPGIIKWPRFFFDNTFKIVLVLIIVNMIAGIIIDTFGALKDILQQKEEDMKRYCFICGIDREKLDKSSDNKQGFESHIKRDHYMWNYVFYKAYLNFKEPTEYDGNESYAAAMIEKFDLSWFPINRALAIKDEENEVNEKVERIEKVSKNVENIRSALQSNISRMNRIAEKVENH